MSKFCFRFYFGHLELRPTTTIRNDVSISGSNIYRLERGHKLGPSEGVTMGYVLYAYRDELSIVAAKNEPEACCFNYRQNTPSFGGRDV